MSLPSYGCVYCILLVSFFGVVAAVVVFIRHHMSLMSNKRMSVVGWSWGARMPLVLRLLSNTPTDSQLQTGNALIPVGLIR